MSTLSEQELHHLAMVIVGKELESFGYEFVAVNSSLKKNPQFVCLKEKKQCFIIVKAVVYPDNPECYDTLFMKMIKKHALKFDAKTYYAGVGLAHAQDYEKPLNKHEDYVINYKGLVEI